MRLYTSFLYYSAYIPVGSDELTLLTNPGSPFESLKDAKQSPVLNTQDPFSYQNIVDQTPENRWLNQNKLLRCWQTRIRYPPLHNVFTLYTEI